MTLPQNSSELVVVQESSKLSSTTHELIRIVDDLTDVTYEIASSTFKTNDLQTQMLADQREITSIQRAMLNSFREGFIFLFILILVLSFRQQIIAVMRWILKNAYGLFSWPFTLTKEAFYKLIWQIILLPLIGALLSGLIF